jgi:glycine/D-amino acid oxidase-like deaminating enzyme
MKTRFGVSPWLHQFPDSKRPAHPRLRGEHSTDVVIVGAGLTGCAIAYVCAAAGMRPIVLERDRIGTGSTGGSAGLLSAEPGPAFRELAGALGVRAARTAFTAWRHGALDAAAVLRKLSVQCAMRPVDLLQAARASDEKTLRRERDARVEAGLETPWLAGRQAVFSTRLDQAAAAFRIRGGAGLDPYRACLGLAAHAVKRGATFYERTAANKVRFSSKWAEVEVDGGRIRGGTVVIATNSPAAEFKPLKRHFKARETYLVLTSRVPAAMRRTLFPEGTALRLAGAPPRRVRWTSDQRLLLWGGDQVPAPPRRLDSVLVQRTGQLMYELLVQYPAISGLAPEYGWSAPYGETADGLMYIGPHRNYPHHLFAWGGPPDSLAGAFVAARVLLRALQGRAEKADQVFSWTR